MTDQHPFRVVDRFDQGWHATGDHYTGFIGMREGFLPEHTWDDLVAGRGPLRPVEPVTDDDAATMVTLFDEAGRKTITTLAAAIEWVFHDIREQHGGLNGPDSYQWAKRQMVAGRPGSWEAEALTDVMLFGNEMNLAKPPGGPALPDADVEGRRAAGPGRRVDAGVRQAMATVIRSWVANPDRYTEVPETLAHLVSSYADEKAGPDGWKTVADQWLQPGAQLASWAFPACYRLLYSTSAHYDHGLF
jgi:hypothetical protein